MKEIKESELIASIYRRFGKTANLSFVYQLLEELGIIIIPEKPLKIEVVCRFVSHNCQHFTGIYPILENPEVLNQIKNKKVLMTLETLNEKK